MNKKLLLFIAFITFIFLLSGCTYMLSRAICGNEICETGEQSICPSDCEGVEEEAEEVPEEVAEETCTDIGGYLCGSSEMCVGYWLDDDYTCCSEECEDDITAIEFKQGWNYISFPEVQLNDAIEDIFSADFLSAVDSIYSYYDTSWKVWHSDSSIPSDLENIEAGRGYVFIMDSDYTLYLSDIEETLDDIIADEGTTRAPNSVNVYTAWNLIGSTFGEEENIEKPLEDYFWNIEGDYGSLWMFTSTSSGDIEKIDITHNYNLIPTRAYWLYMTGDGEIIP